MAAYTYQAQGTFRGTLLAPLSGDQMPRWITMADDNGINRRSRVTFAPSFKKWLCKPENEALIYAENVWRCYPRFVKIKEGDTRKNYLFLHLFAIELNRTEDCKIYVTGILKRLSSTKTIASIFVPRNLGSKGDIAAGTMIVFLDEELAEGLVLNEAVSLTGWLNGSQLTALSAKPLGKPIPFKRPPARQSPP